MTKYFKIKGGYLCMCFTEYGVVKGVGKTKFLAAYDVYKMTHPYPKAVHP